MAPSFYFHGLSHAHHDGTEFIQGLNQGLFILSGGLVIHANNRDNNSANPQLLSTSKYSLFFWLAFQSSSREMKQRALSAAVNTSCSAAPEEIEEFGEATRGGEVLMAQLWWGCKAPESTFGHRTVVSKQPRGKFTQK